MKKQVLIVEDNKVDQIVQKSILEAAGAEVTTCSDGYKAIELIVDNSFDLILLDLGLPSVGGVQFLLGLRTASSGIEVPIIVVSGSIDSKQKELVKFFGAKEFIQKPMTQVDHESILERYL